MAPEMKLHLQFRCPPLPAPLPTPFCRNPHASRHLAGLSARPAMLGGEHVQAATGTLPAPWRGRR